jgi:D-inositol-3-phosphate glycosyltransferase
MRDILPGISAHFEVHQYALNPVAAPKTAAWAIHPAVHGDNEKAKLQFLDLLRQVEPDVILLVGDIWVVNNHLAMIEDLPSFPIAAYVAIDGKGIHSRFITHFHRLNQVVAFTEFGRRELDSFLDRVMDKLEPARRKPTIIIPHGVDTDFFQPKGRNDGATKKELFGDDPSYADSFIVLNANQNQPRKRIDLTMLGFAAFAKDKPDNVKLYLHMGLQDVGWDIVEMARELSIYDRLIVTSNSAGPPMSSAEQLRMIYNATDVGINTSTGEGWGLVSFEHAATGAPQIVPGHSACEELWSGSAHVLPATNPIIDPSTHVLGYNIHPEDVRMALENIYSNRGYYKEVADRCYRKARSNEFSWKRIGQVWGEVLSAGLHNPYFQGPEAVFDNL